MKISSTTLFISSISAAVIGVIAVGASLIDSPTQARLRKLDEQKVSALRQISTHIEYYRKAHDRLPEQLAQLNLTPKELNDAATGQPYEYKVAGADSYQLCAVFATAPDNDDQNGFTDYIACSVPWHKRMQGRYCFTVSAKACK